MHIDWWTLGLQAINVLVLVWLLRHFLFQPIKAVIEARRAAAAGLLQEAETARAAAQAELASVEARRRDFQREGDAILTAAHAQAAAERKAMLDQARGEAGRILAEAHAVLDRDRAAQRKTLEAEAGELAVAMARRLLDLLPPRQVTLALLDGLATEIDQLQEAARRDLATADAIVIATATPLAPEIQAQWRDHVAQRLGAGPRLEFRHEPALIAGVELRGPHTLLRRNWRADLERLARALPLAPQVRDVQQLA
ncbi:F0F1 ATP synthase subunit B family protein [Roseicella frigidaeris]|uniref:ATP synthase subunit b n=1 Tax=Roseicella frigidaeris TaxID=2230885 RepID=A0A327MAP6_9PROT|nr:ATPase [Roseicella frigidaeris]RAI59990.1 ATPase [Roseicella frigidaeris]